MQDKLLCTIELDSILIVICLQNNQVLDFVAKETITELFISAKEDKTLLKLKFLVEIVNTKLFMWFD